jgi:hypothetical protein
MEDRLHGARFSKKIEINILKFLKNLKKILDILNDDFYMCSKYQCRLLSIPGCVKTKKKLCNEQCKILKLPDIFSFLCRTEYKSHCDLAEP